MNREEIIRMAREAGLITSYGGREIASDDAIERFAALVEANVNAKEKERQRYDIHSCGPDCDRYICVAVRKARQEEREACAKVCDDKAMHCETKAQEAIELGEHDEVSAIRSTAWQISICAAAIRARGKA